ncbi:MAG: hypothetical protein WBF33_18225 [Candidatus Nitrosopolaris sp.]|jgi:antitoxin component of MazEF toxin-antitoxin module
MGETTTLALNAPNKASLRTTIPMFIVKQWGLKSGDQLDWSFSLSNNEMVVVVRKARYTKTTTTAGDLHKEMTKKERSGKTRSQRG